MVTTPTAATFKEADTTFIGNALVYTGKGVRFAGAVAGIVPFGIGSAAEAGMGLAGVGISAAGDSVNSDPATAHKAVKGATEVGASAALDYVPGGKLLNLAGRLGTDGFKAPTDVLSDKAASALLGEPSDMTTSAPPLGTPSSGAKLPGTKKPVINT